MVIFRTWVTCRCRQIYPSNSYKITSNIFLKNLFHETFKLTLCWLKLLWFLSLLTLDHYKQACTTPKMTKVHLQLSTVSRVQMFRLHELAQHHQQARQRRQGSYRTLWKSRLKEKQKTHLLFYNSSSSKIQDTYQSNRSLGCLFHFRGPREGV